MQLCCDVYDGFPRAPPVYIEASPVNASLSIPPDGKIKSDAVGKIENYARKLYGGSSP